MIDRRLNHVVATARYGSFTVAAQHVGVTQSALTKSVAELERQLGYPIFERTPRGVILTDKGELFVERAARLLDDAHALLDGAMSGNDPYADVLRIGVCPGSLEYLLLEPVSALVCRHPKVRIEVGGGTFDRVLQQLRTGSIDIAVGYDAAFGEHPDIEREHLTSRQTTFFVRQGHPLLQCSDVPFLESRPLSPICSAIRRRWPPRLIVRAFMQACHDTVGSSRRNPNRLTSSHAKST